MKRFAMLALVLAVCVSQPAFGGGSVKVLANEWDGLVREYVNPFVASGVTFSGTSGWSLTSPQNLVSRQSGVGYRIRMSNANAAPNEVPWLALQMPAGMSFQAGTVITTQQVSSGFDRDMTFEFRLGAEGAATAWSGIAPALTGPGTPGKQTIRTATLDGGFYNTFRLNITPAVYPGYSPISDFNEVIILPDRLTHIEHRNGVTVSGTSTTWGSVQNLLDLDNAETSDGWTGGGGKDVSLTFTFDRVEGELQKIDAIVFWSYGNHPAEFTLKYKDDTGNMVEMALISMLPAGGIGWTLPLQLDKSIETDTIILDFGYIAGSVGLREVMFFTKAPTIPEPATMTLLALGGLALLRRKRCA